MPPHSIAGGVEKSHEGSNAVSATQNAAATVFKNKQIEWAKKKIWFKKNEMETIKASKQNLRFWWDQ